ncbi:uncharacterized protein [Medicago truncatula]|uniref:uncharacterized protein n=1 Tax=Medicago truncatula TaxID=3880 RepID=UPI000D2F3124|nr:uncharacterized protein LOC112420818 [Medicago truncatula]
MWRHRLLVWEEEESVKKCSILFLNTVLQENANDTWRWLLDTANGYTVSGAYSFITTSGDLVDRSPVDDVWHKQIPSKVSLFVWRLFRNRLPTKENLVHRRVIQPDNVACASRCGHPETAKHLFLDYNIFGSLWYHVWLWLSISFVNPGDIRHHFQQFTNMARLPRATHLFLRIIWFATAWVLWKERNNHDFQNTVCYSSILLEKVKLNSFSWLKAKETTFNYNYHD